MSDRADLVVVGAGTIGGWASVFGAEAGLGRVVVLEAGLAGDGASSRAAGIVRAQGGTPEAVALGRWSIEFYRGQADRYGTDSGFRQLGYLLLAIDEADEAVAHARIAMQRELGVDVRWLTAADAAALTPGLDPARIRGASFAPGDGAISPPRNVRAYSLAMQQRGVELRERTAFRGLRLTAGRVTGVETSAGPIDTNRVILTGGPTLRHVGELAGIAIPVGGARHTVAVTEPAARFQPGTWPMVFDVGAGLYWRPEEDGLLFGWSDPDDAPGVARAIDWPALERTRQRLAELVPPTRDLDLRRAWAATIDFTADHRPIIGPGLTADREPIEGLTVASAGGHGMMWGPAVARAATDVAIDGRTDLLDLADVGLDRFDRDGRSRLSPDPIALPFPPETQDGSPIGQ
jgi:glycine/D-amino acid oxidase-like deaminating enzyme